MTDQNPVFGKKYSRFSSVGDSLHDAECVVDLLSAFFANADEMEGFNRADGYDPLHGMSVLLDCIKNAVATAAESHFEDARTQDALKEAVRACAADPAQPVTRDEAADFLARLTALARQQKAAQGAAARRASIAALVEEALGRESGDETAPGRPGSTASDAGAAAPAREPKVPPETEAARDPARPAGDTYPRIGPSRLPVREAAIAATIAGGYSVEAVAQAVNMKKGAVERIAGRLRGSGVLPPEDKADDARAASC